MKRLFSVLLILSLLAFSVCQAETAGQAPLPPEEAEQPAQTQTEEAEQPAPAQAEETEPAPLMPEAEGAGFFTRLGTWLDGLTEAAGESAEAAGAWLQEKWGGLEEGMKGLGEDLSRLSGDAGAWIEAQWNALMEQGGTLGENLLARLRSALNAVLQFIRQYYQKILTLFRTPAAQPAAPVPETAQP